MYTLALSYIVGAIFAIFYYYKAAKQHTGELAANITKGAGMATIVYLILIVILWSSIDAFGYDATWLFGIVSIIWVAIAGIPPLRIIK